MKQKEPKQLKERMLLLTYIYRSLPAKYIRSVCDTPKDKEAARWTINNLIKAKYVVKKTSLPLGDEYLVLTINGFRYVTEKLLHDPKRPFYTYKESRSLLKPVYLHS